MDKRTLALIAPLAGGLPANVPCNGCTACCRNPRRFLIPEHDDVASYDHQWFDDPIAGRRPMLANKPNGECVYLTEAGCSIHERAPRICRTFDCRTLYRAYSRTERRRMTATGQLSQAVMEAARVRCR